MNSRAPTLSMPFAAVVLLATLIGIGAVQAQHDPREPRRLGEPSSRACVDACTSACRAEAERCRSRDPRNAGACAAEANLCRLRCSADCR